jgi:hypothetical protein
LHIGKEWLVVGVVFVDLVDNDGGEEGLKEIRLLHKKPPFVLYIVLIAQFDTQKRRVLQAKKEITTQIRGQTLF